MSKAMRSTSNTSLVLASTDTSSILEKLDAEISKMKKIETTPWKVKGKGEIEGFATPIQNETLIENLIRMGASVRARETTYNDYAASILGSRSFPVFTINGATSSDVDHDIQLRIAIIDQKETLEKLNSFKDRMSSFLSEADKKNQLMKEMEGFFDNK